MIFHLVTQSEFVAQLSATAYQPVTLSGIGFVHCANEPSVLPVADDHFTEASGPVLLLEIDPTKLLSEVRYEAPAPIAGSGSGHLATAALFPHVYGPIARQAIVRVGFLIADREGFQWPTELMSLEQFLARS